MTERFFIPARFDASYSLLGRFVRARAGDRLRAEGFFFGWLVVLLALVALVGMAVSAFRPDWTGMIVGCFGACLIVCAVGRRPPATVDLGHGRVTVRRRGQTPVDVALQDVTEVSRVAADTYYGHYRRFSRVVPVIGPMHGEMVLLRTSETVLVLGIDPAECDRFIEGVRESLPEAVGQVA